MIGVGRAVEGVVTTTPTRVVVGEPGVCARRRRVDDHGVTQLDLGPIVFLVDGLPPGLNDQAMIEFDTGGLVAGVDIDGLAVRNKGAVPGHDTRAGGKV